MENYVLGIDYGTDSCRAVIINTKDGSELGSSVFTYPRWAEGKYCDPGKNMFRQHPLDYLEGLEASINGALAQAPEGTGSRIRGIAVDTTGSTPVAVTKEGIPLALTEGFKDNPNAMFVLWKDHTAVKEADEINSLAVSWGGVDYTKYEGGIYSSEWFWAKVLHVLREDSAVRDAAYSWVEHCDWMPALLTGNTDPLELKRSRCAAGHKAMWHPDFNGLPSEEFLVKLDPVLSGLRGRLYKDTFTSDVSAGTLTSEWAERLGLSMDVTVSVGAFDAHMGAVGGEIKAYSLIKVMGTSTCDMLVAPMDAAGDTLVRGICGQVDGSIVPGMLGLEAGQSAFGDIYAWFKKLISWPLELLLDSDETDERTKSVLKDLGKRIIPELEKAAMNIPPGESGIMAVDWLNGRRTPDADQTLKGGVMGLTLGSDAPKIYRALVEATAFGSRAIVQRFADEGVVVEEVIAIGGISRKSPLVMQIVADVMNKTIKVARSEQTVALGAAMFAAVSAKLHSNTGEAQKAMGNGFEAEYHPIPANVLIYNRLYAEYQEMGGFIEQFIKDRTSENKTSKDNE